MDNIIFTELKDNWTSSLKILDLKDENMFNYLIYLYSDPRRYYHNYNHVYNSIIQIRHFNFTDLNKALLSLILWFHDAVYDVTAPKGLNEEISGDILYQFLSNQNRTRSAFLGKEIISLTTYEKDYDPTLSDLAQTALDIDLSGLGNFSFYYVKNMYNIIKEYEQHYSITTILEGRKKFLEGMLDRKRIYHTDLYYSKYEKRARTNIQNELNLYLGGR